MLFCTAFKFGLSLLLKLLMYLYKSSTEFHYRCYLYRAKYVSITAGERLSPELQKTNTFSPSVLIMLLRCYAAVKRFEASSYSRTSLTAKRMNLIP
jgi:hypothetical protein